MQSFELAWLAVIVFVVAGVKALAEDRTLAALVYVLLAVLALSAFTSMLAYR